MNKTNDLHLEFYFHIMFINFTFIALYNHNISQNIYTLVYNNCNDINNSVKDTKQKAHCTLKWFMPKITSGANSNTESLPFLQPCFNAKLVTDSTTVDCEALEKSDIFSVLLPPRPEMRPGAMVTRWQWGNFETVHITTGEWDYRWYRLYA